MAKRKSSSPDQFMVDYERRISPALDDAPWLLRITEWKDKPVPVFIVKERQFPDDDEENDDNDMFRFPRSVLKDRGLLYGDSLRRCLPVLARMLSRIQDADGVSYGLERFLKGNSISFRGNLPLDEEAGSKITLLFKLQERIKEMDRVELMARRIRRFTREEARYWLSRMSDFTPEVNRWATAGMKIMLGGQPRDRNVEKLLEKLRSETG